MDDKFDGGIGFGLSLSLSLGYHSRQSDDRNRQSLKLNLSPFSSLVSQNDHHLHRRASLGDLFHSSSGKNCNSTSQSQRGIIDMNQSPAVPDPNDQGGASSPNSTISSLSAGGKRGERELQEAEAERASCSLGGSDEEEVAAGGDLGDGDGSRKKLRLSKEQSVILEETFKEHNTLNPKEKVALAKQLNLRPRQVEVWFQNRRARTKLKQTEVDCEYLKRCCENLTQENRRLQKEVQELRALKLSPELYTQMTPPTTLTMCPSCERVAVSSAGAGATQNRQQPTSYLKRPVAVKAWLPLTLNTPPSNRS